MDNDQTKLIGPYHEPPQCGDAKDGRPWSGKTTCPTFHPETKVLYMSHYTDNTIVHYGVLNEGGGVSSETLHSRCVGEKGQGSV